MVAQLNRMEPVPLRDLWPNEARDFTMWLASNLDILSEKLGMTSLSSTGTAGRASGGSGFDRR